MPLGFRVLLFVGLVLIVAVALVTWNPMPGSQRRFRFGSRRQWSALHQCGNVAGLRGFRLDLLPKVGQTVMVRDLFLSIHGPRQFALAYSGDQIAPPGQAGTNGVFNDYFFVVVGATPGPLLTDGWYVAEWYLKRDVGLTPLRRRFFKIRDGACVPR